MTQGLLTIVENGKVKYKIIAGSDGYNAKEIVVDYLNDELVGFTPEELYEIALEHDFGSEESLVVSYIDNENTVAHYHRTGELEHNITPWYWDQFFVPDFNPRWKYGTADHYILVTHDKEEDDV